MDTSKAISKRGKRGKQNIKLIVQNNKVNISKVEPTLYEKLVNPVKRNLPILIVRPTNRPRIIEAPVRNIEIITIDPPVEEALEQRRQVLRQEIRQENEPPVLLIESDSDVSDAETVLGIDD